MDGPTRRGFLAGLAGAGSLGLAGCLGTGFPGGGASATTAYVGAYHWGFILLDDEGRERASMVLDPGDRLRLVAFNTAAHEAVDSLPEAIRSAVPDHEALEARNEERIPTPPSGDLHDALAVANQRYPDHSVAVVHAGHNQRGPMMGGGMMGGGLALPHAASRPGVMELQAQTRGDFTLACLHYCGYGHPFMELPGAFVVR